jgi:formate hydrogenlyase subunit 3/multisubunit Na+/H+ antiporter MnhD subunit
MTEKTLLVSIFLPIIAGLMVLVVRGNGNWWHKSVTFLATVANLVLAGCLFGKNLDFSANWVGGTGALSGAMEFTLRLYHFSGFILLAGAGFAMLVTLYSLAFMKDRPRANQFYAYLLISLGMVNGAVLADNLVLLLFFWEGLLGTLFGMIAIGRPGAFKTATKAFIIVGITDLCMMLGITLTGYLARQAGATDGYMNISTIAGLNLSATGLGALAMILLMIGAISKAGSMPFHSWIPDAAVDAPLPFMAFMPASLEKLIGIYFLARISLDMFHLTAHSGMSMLMMIVGSATILLAVMMALVQKDYKRLLSYHAISQVGYMILGIGTALPIGIIGGLFHMINHAMYKSCLFLTGGAVEKQTGTTDLAKLGGIARKMPVTFFCFIIAAAAISGVPPLNGYFSKELVYDAAMESNIIFYLAAVLGTFFTAASFLKLGHAAYLGKPNSSIANVKEAPLAMLLPMIVIAAGCVLFGVYNYLPLQQLIEPIIKGQLEGETFAGLMPRNWLLPAMTMVAVIGALINHLMGTKASGNPLGAVDHIHYAPGFDKIYRRAENRGFDPYDLGLKLTAGFARLGWWLDRGINWIYDGAVAGWALTLSAVIRYAHNGNYATYVLWSLIAAVAIIVFLIQ